MNFPDLSGESVFITAGTNDPLISQLESVELQSLIGKSEANVECRWENRGHQLTIEEVEPAAEWYTKIVKGVK